MDNFILNVRDENGNFVGIPAIKGDKGEPSVGAVLYDQAQTLTEDQKTQGRTNIGAGTSSFSGSYSDLENKPTIPAAQVQSNWDQATTTAKDYIENKPTIPTELPNPSALTFTGAATGTYDGSSAVTINIPQGGGGSAKMDVVYIQLGGGEGPLETLMPKGNTIYAYLGSSETPIEVLFASSALGGYNEVGQTIVFEAPSELIFNFMSEDVGGICRMDGYSDAVGDNYSYFKYTVLIGHNGIYIDRKKYNN